MAEGLWYDPFSYHNIRRGWGAMLPFNQESNYEAIMSWTAFGGQGADRNWTKRSLSMRRSRRVSWTVIGWFDGVSRNGDELMRLQRLYRLSSPGWRTNVSES